MLDARRKKRKENNREMDYLEEPEKIYDLKKRTKRFALDCIKMSESLPPTYFGNHVRGQLLRSSTSVASNYRAAKHAQSIQAFISKISIVIEESDESEFWLEIILENNMIENDNEAKRLWNEAHELTSIFVKTRITAQKNLRKD